jgi:hypothetical protein
MVLITCKKCGDINYLTSKALGNLTDFGFKYRYCNAINRITLKDGELNRSSYCGPCVNARIVVFEQYGRSV